MGRVKLKNRARDASRHDPSLPVALDAKRRALSSVDFHRVLAAYRAHAETILACPCEGIGNPLLIPPDLSRDEVEMARSAVLAYVDALSWQKSTGAPGVPAISEDFRVVLGDLLRPLQCRYLQIGINGDTLRIVSEDILPGEPFGLVTRIDVDQGYPSLHVVRSATTVEARHKMETMTMLAYLTPDEKAAILAHVQDEGSVKHEMLDATRIAVGRGYAIPGAGGQVERWFRTHRESLDTTPDTRTQTTNFLAAMTGGAPVVASEATVLGTLLGTGALAFLGHPSILPLPDPEEP